jgi:tetratricopeptide (TPR) repeat protein
MVGVLLCAASAASAQLPERFENLKFFPTNISRDSLVGVMRSFSFSLGVRCVYCHVGEDSPTLAGIDWKSDEKPTKRAAREMLRMVADINTRVQSSVTHTTPMTVKCATCHRGVRRPIPLEDSLYTVVTAGGGAIALATYDSLRALYHGRSAFDFGSGTLIRVSERLYVEKRHEDALPLLRRNAELFPRFWNSYWDLGMHLEALNRPAEAIAAYRGVLERLPNHAGATARLRVLSPPPT